MTNRCQDNLSIHGSSELDFIQDQEDDINEDQNINQSLIPTEQLDDQNNKKKQYNEFNLQNSPLSQNLFVGQESQWPIFTVEEKFELEDQKSENESIISTNIVEKKKNVKLTSKSTKIKKGLAAETKNIPKNLGLAFQRFIRNNLDSKSKTIYAVKSFLKVPSSQFGKFQFKNYLKNQYLRQLAQQFFGSCAWAREFLYNNKTDISLYFRYIDEWNSNI